MLTVTPSSINNNYIHTYRRCINNKSSNYTNNISNNLNTNPMIYNYMPINFKGYSPSACNKKLINNIIDIVKSDSMKNIVVVTHDGPDGDAIGSAIAAKRLFEKATGKAIKFITSRKLSDSYSFISKEGEVEIVKNHKDKKEFFKSIGNPDLIISVDVSNTKLFNKDIYENVIKHASNIIKIDHHDVPTDKTLVNEYNFGNINLVDANKESAAQIIMEFVEPLGIKPDENISDPISLGLITDSGSFKYIKNSSAFYKDASELAETSNLKEIMNSTNAISLGNFKAMSAILNNEIRLNDEGDIAYFIFDTSKYENCRAKEVTINVFDKLSQLKGLKYYFAVTRNPEYPDLTASIRSVKTPIVDKIKELGGGGHECACGLKMSNVTPEEMIQKIMDKLKEIKTN